MSDDLFLQSYQLKYLTLKNRIMTTSHEPAYPVDGMHAERYRAYHEECAKAGLALTMTALQATSKPRYNCANARQSASLAHRLETICRRLALNHRTGMSRL